MKKYQLIAVAITLAVGLGSPAWVHAADATVFQGDRTGAAKTTYIKKREAVIVTDKDNRWTCSFFADQNGAYPPISINHDGKVEFGNNCGGPCGDGKICECQKDFYGAITCTWKCSYPDIQLDNGDCPPLGC